MKITEYLEYLLRLGRVEHLQDLMTKWQSDREFRVFHNVLMGCLRLCKDRGLVGQGSS